MKITEIVTPDLTFRVENNGYHHGQSDRRLVAYRGDEEVGYIEYSDYEGQPHVAMISVPGHVRREGIGTALLHQLQSEYPGVEINMSTPTPMGAKLIGSMPQTVTPNEEYVQLKARLEQLYAKEAEFQKFADTVAANPTDEGRQKFYAITDAWNAVNDEVFEIERRLQNMHQSTRTFHI